MSYHWIVTAKNPSMPLWSEPTGWKLHAVLGGGNDDLKDLRWTRAACGLRARYGWASDLFIEDKCARCERAINGEQ